MAVRPEQLAETLLQRARVERGAWRQRAALESSELDRNRDTVDRVWPKLDAALTQLENHIAAALVALVGR